MRQLCGTRQLQRTRRARRCLSVLVQCSLALVGRACFGMAFCRAAGGRKRHARGHALCARRLTERVTIQTLMDQGGRSNRSPMVCTPSPWEGSAPASSVDVRHDAAAQVPPAGTCLTGEPYASSYVGVHGAACARRGTQPRAACPGEAVQWWARRGASATPWSVSMWRTRACRGRPSTVGRPRNRGW